LYTQRDTFPHELQEGLENILAKFAVRMLPKPSMLLNVIEQVAHYEFINKPAAAIALVNSGIPVTTESFGVASPLNK